MIAKLVDFISNGIWRIRVDNQPRHKSFLITQARIILLALRGFGEDKCQLRASALTFYTLLSIVPVLAMAFGISKGFGLEKLLERQLLEKIPGQQEVVTQMIGFARSMLENTQGGLIAGIGVAVLFWTVIKVLGNIEKSFNDIWGIKKGRSMSRKFSDYLSIMLICPILFVMSSSMTVLIASQVKAIVDRISFLGGLAPVIFTGLKLLPYAVFWILFTFVYIFMPNAKVRFSSGLVAGIIAGTVYQLVQGVYIGFQIGVAKYNAIYGSFAALPLFLAWLQLSWVIVLLGAEISFAHQNVDTYEFEPDSLRVSHSFKRLLTLEIMHRIVRGFSRGEKALNAVELSHVLDIPVRLVRQITFELSDAGLISEMGGDNGKGSGYLPAHDISDMTVAGVITALDNAGLDNIPVHSSKEMDTMSESLQAFQKMIEKSPANRKLADI